MWFSASFGAISVLLIVVYFLNRVVGLRNTPAYILVLACTAFFLPASIVVLLPIDLVSGRYDLTSGDKPLSYLDHNVLLKLWRALYWLSFMLTLTILPIVQSYVEAGHKDFSYRLNQAIKQNIRFQLIYLGIGLLAILYILVNTKLNSIADFKALLIACANTWGLFLALTFMGHGLVSVPRSLWYRADYSLQRSEVLKRATSVWERKERVTNELHALAAQANNIIASNEIDQDWRDELSCLVAKIAARAPGTDEVQRRGWFTRQSRSKVLTQEHDLADLASRIRAATNRSERYHTEWALLIEYYIYIADIAHGALRKRLVHRTFRQILSPRFASFIYCFALPWSLRIVAILLGLLSTSLIWAEILINRDTTSLRFIALPATTRFLEVWSVITLLYMAICCYTTLLKLKIFDRHALLDHGHTTYSSLLFYGSYCCRVTIPLAYNFITLLPSETYRKMSTFATFLGSAIDLQPLGRQFNNWLPLYILVPVIITLLQTSSRSSLTRWLDEDDLDSDPITEGRAQLVSQAQEKYGSIEAWS